MPRLKKSKKTKPDGPSQSQEQDLNNDANASTSSVISVTQPAKIRERKRKQPDSTAPETINAEAGIQIFLAETSKTSKTSKNPTEVVADSSDLAVSTPKPKKQKLTSNQEGQKKTVIEKKSKKPKRKRGRPRKQLPAQHDLDSGALQNFVGQSFSVKGKKNKKQLVDSSQSFVWLSFWTDEEKKQLMHSVANHGVDCDPRILQPFIPSRSVEDVKAFTALLQKNAKKIVLSPDFNLGFGMSAMDVVNCRDPFVRIPAGPDILETTPAHQCIKQAFLDAVETPDTSDEIVQPGTLDFDRIYRVIAHSLDPNTSAAGLRSLCSPSDLSVLRFILNRITDQAGSTFERHDDLFSILRSRMVIETSAFPFSAENPTGPLGETARAVACLPDVNPLRLRPSDLIYSPTEKQNFTTEDLNENQLDSVCLRPIFFESIT